MIARNRHDLLDITDQGRHWAAMNMAQAPCVAANHDLARQLVSGTHDGKLIPGIARREEGPLLPGAVPVGFSSPYRVDGDRLRVPAFVMPQEVVRVTTPYEVLQMGFPLRTSCLTALAELKTMAAEIDLSLGVWGSAGLEIYTGLEYTDDESDLDIIVRADDPRRMTAFYEEAQQTAAGYACRVDLEIELATGFGVKYAELMRGDSSVLAKGLDVVALVSRDEIMEVCSSTRARPMS